MWILLEESMFDSFPEFFDFTCFNGWTGKQKPVVKRFFLRLVAWMHGSDLKVRDRLNDFLGGCNISVIRLSWTAYWVTQLLGLIWKKKKNWKLYSSDCSGNCTWPYVYQWIVLKLQSSVNDILIGKQTKDRQVNDW